MPRTFERGLSKYPIVSNVPNEGVIRISPLRLMRAAQASKLPLGKLTLDYRKRVNGGSETLILGKNSAVRNAVKIYPRRIIEQQRYFAYGVRLGIEEGARQSSSSNTSSPVVTSQEVATYSPQISNSSQERVGKENKQQKRKRLNFREAWYNIIYRTQRNDGEIPGFSMSPRLAKYLFSAMQGFKEFAIRDKQTGKRIELTPQQIIERVAKVYTKHAASELGKRTAWILAHEHGHSDKSNKKMENLDFVKRFVKFLPEFAAEGFIIPLVGVVIAMFLQIGVIFPPFAAIGGGLAIYNFIKRVLIPNVQLKERNAFIMGDRFQRDFEEAVGIDEAALKEILFPTKKSPDNT